MPGMKSVPPHALDGALAFLRRGGRLVVPSYTRPVLLTKRTLEKFEAAGAWLLREEGEGYRLRRGRSSVYLLPGQLSYLEE